MPFSVDVIPTKRKEEVAQRVREFLAKMSQAAPQLTPFWADVMFMVDSETVPQFKIVAERLKRALPQTADPDDSPAEVLFRENATLKQQLEAANQQAQQAMQLLTTKQAEIQAKTQGKLQEIEAAEQAKARTKQAEAQVKMATEETKQREGHEDELEGKEFDAAIAESAAEAERRHEIEVEELKARHAMELERLKQRGENFREGLKQAGEDVREESRAGAERDKSEQQARTAREKNESAERVADAKSKEKK